METPQTVIERRLKGSSYRKLARELGISAGHLHSVAKGKKEPGDGLVRALGLDRVTVVTYRRKGNGK